MTKLRYVGALSYELRADGKAFQVSPGTEFVVSDFAAAAVVKRGTPVEVVSSQGDGPPAAPVAAVQEVDADEDLGSDEDAEPSVGDEPVVDAAPVEGVETAPAQSRRVRRR